MARHKLRLDTLRVDSFQTEPVAGGRGTVRGHDTVFTENCTEFTCPTFKRGCDTANNTCYNTCVGCTVNCPTEPDLCIVE